jgi:defect-in-organelle-trafficking protein DotD
MQPVSIRWSGPIEQIARVLAERAGLKFRVKGNVPAVPLTVSVDAYQLPIIHILRDIGYQAGHRADLTVDSMGGAVEIRYAPADQSR